MKKITDSFENRLSYKLYRTIPEIIHPSISKRNISNYRIVLSDNLIPIRVFYPKMVSNIDKVILYIHGENINNKHYKYGDISRMFAKELKCLVISIDYDDTDKYNKLVKNIHLTCKYIIEEFNKLDINKISIFGDSIGSNMALEVSKLLDKKKTDLKLVLFYPQILSKAKRKKNIFNSEISSLTIIGSADPNYSELVKMSNEINKKGNVNKLLEVEFQSHSFLNNKAEEEKNNVFNTIDKFIK